MAELGEHVVHRTKALAVPVGKAVRVAPQREGLVDKEAAAAEGWGELAAMAAMVAVAVRRMAAAADREEKAVILYKP